MQRLDGLGALAGGIAHDLNNVLSPILTAAQLLKESSKDTGTTGIVDIVERSARRGGSCIQWQSANAVCSSTSTGNFVLHALSKE